MNPGGGGAGGLISLNLRSKPLKSFQLKDGIDRSVEISHHTTTGVPSQKLQSMKNVCKKYNLTYRG